MEFESLKSAQRKIVLATFLTIVVSCFSYSQSVRYHEFGAMIYNSQDIVSNPYLNPAITTGIGFIYKVGNDKAMLRFSMFTANISSSKSKGQFPKNSSLMFEDRLGFEWRFSLNEEFRILTGVEAITGLKKWESVSDFGASWSKYDTKTYGGSVIVGVSYVFKRRFSITAEFIPSYILETGSNRRKYENQTTEFYEKVKNQGIGFDTGLINVTFSYRLTTEKRPKE